MIKKFLKQCPQLYDFLKNLQKNVYIKNYYKTHYPKNCLIMYIVVPFAKGGHENDHQNSWQVKEIAWCISQYGYNIDVIDFRNTQVFLNKKYDLIFEVAPSVNRVYYKKLKKDYKKIAFLTGSNPSFQNSSELKRIRDLEKRKGVQITPRRQFPLFSKEFESCNAYFMIGNEYNWKTYTNEFNLKDPYFIKNTGHEQEYRFDETKKDKRAFLYFGSAGQVHKGLDLLLDIFSKEDFSCELYVCGSFKNEKDFEQAYYKELYETKNIHPIGFVSIESDEFKELTEKCVYSIMPSCSEGLAGSVLTTMSAGLINICSRECGLEDDEVIHLNDCSLETIEKTVLEYANKDNEWIKSESKRAYDIIQERYSKEKFVESLIKALGEVLK